MLRLEIYKLNFKVAEKRLLSRSKCFKGSTLSITGHLKYNRSRNYRCLKSVVLNPYKINKLWRGRDVAPFSVVCRTDLKVSGRGSSKAVGGFKQHYFFPQYFLSQQQQSGSKYFPGEPKSSQARAYQHHHLLAGYSVQCFPAVSEGHYYTYIDLL